MCVHPKVKKNERQKMVQAKPTVEKFGWISQGNSHGMKSLLPPTQRI